MKTSLTILELSQLTKTRFWSKHAYRFNFARKAHHQNKHVALKPCIFLVPESKILIQ